MVCQRAVTLIVDLCLHNSTLLDQDTCQDYLFLLSSQSSDQKESGKDSNLLPEARFFLRNEANIEEFDFLYFYASKS